MTIYNVFDSLEEASIAQEKDFEQYKLDNGYENNSLYWQSTSSWANISQRLDGKYVYMVCPYSINTYKQEEFNQNWFSEG
jgi:hypothetical protein